MSKDPSTIKRKHSEFLMTLPNVVALGVGPVRSDDTDAVEMGIKVFVSRKLPRAELAKDELIPHELDGIPVEIEVLAPLRKQ